MSTIFPEIKADLEELAKIREVNGEDHPFYQKAVDNTFQRHQERVQELIKERDFSKKELEYLLSFVTSTPIFTKSEDMMVTYMNIDILIDEIDQNFPEEDRGREDKEFNPERMQEKFLVLKHEDIKSLTEEEQEDLKYITQQIYNDNKYLVINTDEEYAGKVQDLMKEHGHWG